MTYRSLLHAIFRYTMIVALTGLMLVPCALRAVTSPASAGSPSTTLRMAERASPTSVVIRVPAEELSRLSGIKPIDRIDYGAFSVLEISAQDLKTLKRARVRLNEEKNADVIGLQGRQISARGSSAAMTSTGPGLYLLHVPGPTKREWMSEIESSGAAIVSYVPENTYLVWMDPAKLVGKTQKKFIKWSDAYRPDQKISPSLVGASGKLWIAVSILDDNAGETIDAMRTLGAQFLVRNDMHAATGVKLQSTVFSADASLLPKIAALSGVVYITGAALGVTLDDEVACQISAHNLDGSNIPLLTPPYQTWLATKGFNGSGSKIAVVDTGCDTNNNTTCHLDLRGRLSSILLYPGTYQTDTDGHGTHVAAIAAGSGALGTRDATGYLYGQGIAPGSSLVIQNAAASFSYFPPVPWETITRDAVRSGAIVSNNSWSLNSFVNVGYTADCATFDRLVRDADDGVSGAQPLTIVFSLGNNGPNPSTVSEPKESKNIITVGASENYRLDAPLGGACSMSSDVRGIANISSRGPCADGRIAPTIVAPGTSIASAASYTGNYLAGGCRALISESPPDYAWMTGTSMSAPAVSGAVALIGQWWRSTHNNQDPSPAMVKAILVNSAEDIAGGPDGRGGTLAHIPNNDQGWGRLNMADAVAPPNTYYDDQIRILTDSGQIRRYRVEAIDPGKPLKVTLAWTDAPGLPGAQAWVNDLDLNVTEPGGTVYQGNVFNNGWSAAGGVRDHKNNVECVFLPNPSGIYTVSVIAANIAGDAVPGNIYPFDQDYALVIRNGRVGGTTIQPYTPVDSLVPAAPDHYAAAQEPVGWSAIALKPAAGGSSDLTVYSDPGFAGAAAVSDLPDEALDFIAIDGNRPTPTTVYPLVDTIAGTAGYTLQWATRTADLAPGVAVNQSFGLSDLIRTWDITVSGAASCGMRLEPTSGDLDLGLCIFESASGQPATYYRVKNQSLAGMNPAGPGSAYTVLFQLPAAGRYGVVVWKNGGTGTYSLKFDSGPPTIPVVTIQSPYTTDLTHLAASWISSDPQTGIAKCEYAIGSTPGGTNVADWTDAGTATNVDRTGISLTVDFNYYFTVRATNGFGMTATGTSGPTLAVLSVPNISTAKASQNGTPIKLMGKSVSAVYPNEFYIEELDRSSGIAVQWTGAVAEGAEVTIIGRMNTNYKGERFIQPLQVTTD